jgi:hypothetical protein
MIETNKPKLFRVDAKIGYLILTKKADYTFSDFLAWVKEDMHSGEFDEDDNALDIKEVKSSKQVQDYLDREFAYTPYATAGCITDSDYLSDIISDLGLDAEALADRLRVLGYTVTPPDGSKPKTKNKTKKSK